MTNKRKKLFILIILILIALILLAIYLLRQGNYLNGDKDKGKARSAIYVSKVIDGDTFEMSDNMTVRLLCVNNKRL